MFKGFGIALKNYGKAIGFIFNNGLWWYFLFPLLLNVGIWYGGSEAFGMLSDWIENWLLELMGLTTDDSGVAGVAATVVGGIVALIFKIAFWFVFAYAGGYIVVIILSPVLAFLSEKTEKIITGNDYPFSGDQLMRDIWRGLLIALRNFSIELAFIIGIFLLGFVPVLGWIVGFVGAIFLFFVASYFYGFSFMDYVSERQRLSISGSVKLMRKNRGAAIGNGMIFALVLMIPFCGVFFSGFIAIVSVVSGTLTMHDLIDLSDSPHAKKTEITKAG